MSRLGAAPAGDVWFHGASVGDARALLPLTRAVLEARPDVRAVYSAQTRGGLDMWRQLVPPEQVTSPPLDAPPLPGRALDAAGCRLLVLEYLELWPNWVAAAAARDIPVVVVDGRVTRKSLRIKPVLTRSARKLTWFSAQSEGDAARAAKLGVPDARITVDGNGKYDQASLLAPEPTLSEFGQFDVVLGSLHEDEEAQALTTLAVSGLRALIAPRYPARAAAIRRWAMVLGVRCRRRTRGPAPDARWVVLDTVGELAGAYAHGRVAVMGGTFGKRDGQNLVEAASHGIPVVFGPRTGNVALEAGALRGAGGYEVEDWAEAWRCAAARLVDPGPDPRAAIEGLRGATARRLPRLLALLDAPHER